MISETLEFESPRFLHSLFADDVTLLREMGSRLDVKLTTREGWIKIDGDAPQVERARSVFAGLERVRRSGGGIDRHAFTMAVEAATEEEPEPPEALLQIRLQTSRKRPPVTPRTRTQAHYLKAMQDHEVVFGVGPAGTGKTFLAMAHAVAALKAGQARRIILTRPAVEAGEALGFLPGDLKEKLYPYLRPLYDALHDLLDPEELEKWVERGVVEIAPLAYMRGRTLAQAVVILDEAQNTTREQMLMLLTRLGEGSTCLVTGDPMQIDLRPKGASGLREAMRILPGTQGVAFMEFQRHEVVRHPVVSAILGAYEKNRAAEPGKERD
ncbi:MAG: PhoH family protein [Verrucomicrobiota bacterium]